MHAGTHLCLYDMIWWNFLSFKANHKGAKHVQKHLSKKFTPLKTDVSERRTQPGLSVLRSISGILKSEMNSIQPCGNMTSKYVRSIIFPFPSLLCYILSKQSEG